MPDISSDLLVGITVAGLAVSCIAIGLVIGLLFSRPQAPPRMGYTIDRDERGRISGIIALPSLGDMVS